MKHGKIKPEPITEILREARRKKRSGEKKKSSHGIFENLRYALGIAGNESRMFLLTSILIILGETAENLTLSYTDKFVVDLATGTGDIVKLSVICVLLIIGTRFFRFIWRECTQYEDYVEVTKYNYCFQRRLMKKNLETDYENNEKASVNDSLRKATDTAGYMMTVALRTMRKSATNAVGVFAFGGILAVFHPIMLPIVILPAVASYYINRHKMMWQWCLMDKWQSLERQLEYIRYEGERFHTAKDVRIFGMQRWFGALWGRTTEKRYRWYEQQDVVERRFDILNYCVRALGNFAAYAFIILQVAGGRITPGEFALYINAISLLNDSVQGWCDNFSGYQWISENMSYIRDYYDMKDKTNRGEGTALPKGQCEIEFRNVSYTYFGAEEPTIRNISFTLHNGEKLALVGLNGAGKTTLIKLMCGLYTPTDGEILLNGIPVNEYNRTLYFKLFSTVFQDILTLPVTVAENISGSHVPDQERVLDCLKKAGLYESVMALPQKENTRMGRSLFEDAHEFSGGQQQKLALAKALYKDAPVLLLDEPTAALDPIAEQDMYLQYAEFAKEKSSVFISHRLSSTRFCDRILLIENGQIKEEGTHTTLMQKGGTYAELFEMQSSYYREKEAGTDGRDAE